MSRCCSQFLLLGAAIGKVPLYYGGCSGLCQCKGGAMPLRRPLTTPLHKTEFWAYRSRATADLTERLCFYSGIVHSRPRGVGWERATGFTDIV